VKDGVFETGTPVALGVLLGVKDGVSLTVKLGV
jgi:hypothetical protein